MDFIDDLGEGLNKLFLAGVGAVAMGAEMSGALIDELVKKGEETVEQGKSLNEELSKKAKDTVDSTYDAFLKARLQSMTAEEREEFEQEKPGTSGATEEFGDMLFALVNVARHCGIDAEEEAEVEVIVEEVIEEAADEVEE